MEREKLLFVNEAAAGVGTSWEQQLNSGFLNPSNWENSMDQSDPFESALSSIVSSPGAQPSNATAIPATGDSFMIRELIGRLGSICNSGGGGVGVLDDSISLSPQSYLQQQQHQTQHHHNNNTTTSSTNNSCYTTPLNSPPKLNLSMMDPHHNMRALTAASHHNLAPLAADPGFAERAARLSCFGTRSSLHLNNTMNRSSSSSCLETNKLYRVAAGSQMKAAAAAQQQETNNIQDGDSKESSSVSEPHTQSQNDASSSKKRKSAPRTKAKDTTTTTPSSTNDAKVVTEIEESRTKRSKQEEAESNGNENDSGKAKSGGVDGNQKQNNNNNNNNKDNSKPPEPPKDYIHVRARRGQATDSHSLAERVRREKISERMKFLQDLVPGCNKVTGKAVMLDEIINYVQSLQKQVEFLSMKLATVNPRMDFNVEALLSKDMFPSRGALQNALYQVDSSASTFPFGYQPQAGLQPLNGGSIPNNADTQFSINNSNSNNHQLNNAAAAALHRNPNVQLPSSNGYGETPTQAPSFWEDDLQSLVQMGFNQNQPQIFHGSSMAATAQMKIEL